ncbi:hypothetical protein [Mycolicibacterium porcinum]|uniref:hypothetical protein n=1 Tax=Mycolicibacterium porcinum TaxID=39693 RepID=UPI001041DAB7|nr:hypothetical protein [Mycolicibacterium porcinum]
MLTRRTSGSASAWDGCDVLNLFRFTGTPPETVVADSADLTLKDLGVDAPITYRMTMPAGLRIVAIRSRGTAVIGPRRLWGQVTNFLVTTTGDSALIEHTILIDAEARARLAQDITQLGDSVRKALLASLHNAQNTS